MNIPLTFFFLLVWAFAIIPSVSAEPFTQNQDALITHPITTNGSLSPVALGANITIRDPENNYLVLFQPMTYNNTAQEWFFILNSSQTSSLGEYSYTVYPFTVIGDDARDFTFTVTPTGRLFDEGQGIVSLGLLFGSISLAFIFLWFGFKMSENKNLMPLVLLFVVIGFFLVIYSLQLGLTFSVNIIQDESLTGVQTTMFLSILWILSGIAIISFILMSIAFVKNLFTERALKNYGAGFDPITQTYQ